MLQQARRIGVKISVWTDDIWNQRSRSHGPPAISVPCRCKREMQTAVGFGMRLRIRGNLCEPRTWHHDGSRSDPLLVEGGKAGHILRMRNSEILGVEDQQLRIGRVAKPHLKGLVGPGSNSPLVVGNGFPISTHFRER